MKITIHRFSYKLQFSLANPVLPQAIKAFRVPNPVTILNDKIPHLALISIIIVSLVFLALFIFFIWSEPLRKLQVN